MNLQITVSLNAEGQITVMGPVENKLVCYGLLQAAMDVVRDHKPAEASRIVPAVMVPKNGRVS